MKITIREQIMSGNMGDGWGDNYETANQYAEFLSPILRADVLERYPDAEVVVDLSVERASGCSRGIIVDVDGVDDPEQIFEVSDELTEMLSYTEQDAWGKFCDAEAVRDAASKMGRKGGKSKSEAKTRTARENGKRGGRPRKETIVEFNGERCAWIGAWPAKRNSKILIAVLAGTSHSGVVEVGAEYLGTHNDKYGTAYDWYRLQNGARLV